MNLYPGDLKVFVVDLETVAGLAPTVQVAPSIAVVNLLTKQMVLTPPQAMTLTPGTTALYSYAWNTGNQSEGTYAALISYAAGGVVANSKMLEVFKLGDSRILGQLALAADTAKEATTAKDDTVMHKADFVSVDSSTTIQGIYNRISNYPAAIPSKQDFDSLSQCATDIRDSTLGTWVVDKSTNTLTMYRNDNTILQTFNLQNSLAFTSRTPKV